MPLVDYLTPEARSEMSLRHWRLAYRVYIGIFRLRGAYENMLRNAVPVMTNTRSRSPGIFGHACRETRGATVRSYAHSFCDGARAVGGG